MCTNFTLKAEDKSVVVGRAMDFSSPMQPHIIIRRRGEQVENLLKDEMNPEFTLGPKSKYGYVAVGVNDFIPGISKYVATDGMNEAGLSAGFLFMKGTQYPAIDTVNITRNIFLPFLCGWVLAHCGSVDDLKTELPKYNVWFFSAQSLVNQMPLYLAVSDRTGISVCVQFLNNQMEIVDNPVGVSTNEPPLPWHITNLNRYLNLSNYAPDPMTIGDHECVPFGHSGLKGLPGDTTSPSRFLRTAFAKNFSVTPTNSKEAFIQATHMLNIVDAPAGLSRYTDGSMVYPRWSVIKGLTSMQFALRTYDNPAFVALDLSNTDFSNVESRLFPAPEPENYHYIPVTIEKTAEPV